VIGGFANVMARFAPPSSSFFPPLLASDSRHFPSQGVKIDPFLFRQASGAFPMISFLSQHSLPPFQTFGTARVFFSDVDVGIFVEEGDYFFSPQCSSFPPLLSTTSPLSPLTDGAEGPANSC